MNTRGWRRNCGKSWKPPRINHTEQPQRQQGLRALVALALTGTSKTAISVRPSAEALPDWEILVSAFGWGRLVVEPDELVNPDRPERQALVPGEGRQRRGAVNDHCAGHRVVSAAPGDDASARRHDVAVPARRLTEGERHHESSGRDRADAQRCGVGPAGLTAAMMDDPDDGHVL